MSKAVDDALEILLTPDGKGKRKKAKLLMEMCETVNPCTVRQKIQKLLGDKEFK